MSMMYPGVDLIEDFGTSGKQYDMHYVGDDRDDYACRTHLNEI